MWPQSWCVCLEAALRRPDASPRSRRGPWMPRPRLSLTSGLGCLGLTSGLGCLSLASVSPRALDASASPRSHLEPWMPRSLLGPWMPWSLLGVTSGLGCLGLSLGLGCLGLGLSSASPRALDASVSPRALDASAPVSPRPRLGPCKMPRSLLSLASGLGCLGLSLSSASPQALDASVSPRCRLRPWMPQPRLGSTGKHLSLASSHGSAPRSRAWKASHTSLWSIISNQK